MNFLAYEDGISIGQAAQVAVTGIIVVLIVLAVLAVLVVLLSKLVRAGENVLKGKQKNDESPVSEIPAAPVAEAPKSVSGTALPESQSAGSLDLYKTDEKTAAVIMAIVSNESGIPLNRLVFNSIKLIEE